MKQPGFLPNPADWGQQKNPFEGPYVDVYRTCVQGCAKTRVFHQKPSPVGLTGLNRVLMGFMG